MIEQYPMNTANSHSMPESTSPKLPVFYKPTFFIVKQVIRNKKLFAKHNCWMIEGACKQRPGKTHATLEGVSPFIHIAKVLKIRCTECNFRVFIQIFCLKKHTRTVTNIVVVHAGDILSLCNFQAAIQACGNTKPFVIKPKLNSIIFITLYQFF